MLLPLDALDLRFLASLANLEELSEALFLSIADDFDFRRLDSVRILLVSDRVGLDTAFDGLFEEDCDSRTPRGGRK